MKIIFILLFSFLISACQQASEPPIQVEMYTATPTGQGEYLGTVLISETPEGLLFTPDLKHLPQGTHGFHLHENPSCDPAEKDHVIVEALAAGGHFDPQKTGKHEGPNGHGHLGDLPALVVDAQGHATTPVLAPRLFHLKEINHTSLMIHAGGDNYSDAPQPLGGGGHRIVCGVVTQYTRM